MGLTLNKLLPVCVCGEETCRPLHQCLSLTCSWTTTDLYGTEDSGYGSTDNILVGSSHSLLVLFSFIGFEDNP